MCTTPSGASRLQALTEKGNTSNRSRITVTDLDTKIGTLLNGEQIRGKSIDLETEENTITLGRFKHRFRFDLSQ